MKNLYDCEYYCVLTEDNALELLKHISTHRNIRYVYKTIAHIMNFLKGKTGEGYVIISRQKEVRIIHDKQRLGGKEVSLEMFISENIINEYKQNYYRLSPIDGYETVQVFGGMYGYYQKSNKYRINIEPLDSDCCLKELEGMFKSIVL